MEIGGLEWEVTPPSDLNEGFVDQLTHVNIVHDDPQHPIADRVRVTRDEDGAIHMAFDSERNQDYYSGSFEFPAGALRALVDYVEPIEGQQSSHIPRTGWLSRLLNPLRFN